MRRTILLASALVAHTGFAVAQTGEGKAVAGWIEDVILMPGNLAIRAKLDSGARTSSLNAPNHRFVKRNGERWVRFAVTNRVGDTVEYERRIVRTARIKRIKGPVQERPVVILGICLGRYYRQGQVNLVNRDGFNFQMLIGRRFMAGHVIVDPARIFRLPPVCPETGGARE